MTVTMHLNKKPMVSVCVVTYNQRDYIGQCIQSLIEQVTDFPIEIIISDDCSTDGTSEIVSDYVRRFPATIRHIRHDKNIGAYKNFLAVHEMSTGEYIAHVDGDDYCLPGKIQAQAEFLEKNRDHHIVWHPMMILDEASNSIFPQHYDAAKMNGRRLDVNDLIANITIGLHSSKMYRRWPLVRIDGLDALDFSENILHLNQAGGYAGFASDKPLGVYRTNSGISRNKAAIRKKIYRWMAYFYHAGIGDRGLLYAKVLLMVASDFKHRVGSFWSGAALLTKMSRHAFPLRVTECRARQVHVSLDRGDE